MSTHILGLAVAPLHRDAAPAARQVDRAGDDAVQAAV